MVVPSPVPLILSRDAPMSIRRLERDGTLRRIRRGVYARRDEWDALTPWARYVARVHAVARVWTEPVFCLESAAALQGAPVFGEPRQIHLLGDRGQSWREGDVVVHGMSDSRAIAFSEGFRATSPLETTVDLCRVLPPAYGLAVADAHLRSRRGVAPAPNLHEIARAQSHRRGLRRVEWIQMRTTPASESTGESVSRAVIEWLGHEAPELQVEFPHGGGTDRTDFYWRRRRLIGEFDGYEKYRGDDVEATHRRIVDEKRRENRLRSKSAAFARWDWADAHSPASLDVMLRAAGLEPRGPVNAAMLATLASNPRSYPYPPSATAPRPRTSRR